MPRPTSPSSATPGSPSWPRSARSSRWQPWLDELARRRPHRRERLLRRHLAHQQGRRHALRPALVRRHAAAVLPPRPARACRRARHARHLGRPGARARCAASAAGHAAPAAAAGRPSSSRCWRWRCSRTSRCCATAVATATSAAPAFAARSTSTWRSSTSGHAPSITGGDIANLWQEFGRGTFAAFISGPWNIGEFDRRLPAALRSELGHRAAARPERPGRVDRRRLEPGDVPPLAAASADAWHAARVPVPARRCSCASTRSTGDLPPRRSAWAMPPLASDTHAPRLPRAARARQGRARGAGMGAHRAGDAAVATRAVHERWSVEQAGADARRARRRHPRKAPLDAARAARGARRRRAAVKRRARLRAPAGSSSRRRSTVIGLFFVFPVAAALALSLTDFDLYALADLRNLRFVGLDNYVHVLSAAAVLEGAGQHAVLRRRRRAAVDRVSLATALLLHSPLARFKPFFRTALFAPVVTTWSRWR